MSDWTIASPSHGWFQVRLGDCTLEHAESVLAQLIVEPTAPSDLVLTEVGVEPPPKRSWLDRLLRRNRG